MTNPVTLQARFGLQANAYAPRVWPSMMSNRTAEQQRAVVDAANKMERIPMATYSVDVEARTWGLVLVPLAEGCRSDLWGGEPWRRMA